MVERLQAGDPGAVAAAIEFLEADPWTFRSGYAKDHVATPLARHALGEDEQVRVAEVCIRAVDVGDRWEFRRYCRLAARLPAAMTRDRLVERLHSSNAGVERRALWMLAHLRNPRLASDQLTAARGTVIGLAPHSTGQRRSFRNIALRFWSAEWERELLAHVRSKSDQAPAAMSVLASLPRLHVDDPIVIEVVANAVADCGLPQPTARGVAHASAVAGRERLATAIRPHVNDADLGVRDRARRVLSQVEEADDP